MENTARVIPFPGHQVSRQEDQHSAPVRQIRNIDGIKYFNRQQIKLLRRTVRDQAELALAKGNVTHVKEWLAIDLLSSAGMRVNEVASLKCGDIKAGYGESAIFVRDGKGGRSRTVQIGKSLKKHLKKYIGWKNSKGEGTAVDDYLFVGQRGPWSRQALQQLVKKYLKQLGLHENGKSVHALRHSYAVELYRRERDLRAVQKQLGHASIRTTQIYADVLAEDVQRQICGLWGV